MNHFCFALLEQRKRRNGERKGARAVLLGAKAAGSGAGYGTKGPRTSRRSFFWAAVHRWISPIQPPIVFVTEISFFFIVPRDFLGNLPPCCKQSNLQPLVALLFFPRGQEAHQQHALRDSTVFFALDWVDS